MDNAFKTPLQASKWLSIQVLLDEDEMASLLTQLHELKILLTGRVAKRGEEIISTSHFLQKYNSYVAALRNGEVPQDALYRDVFSTIWTSDPDAAYAVEIDNDRHILRASKPAVQLQLHRLGYSSIEDKFRPMIFGKDSIDWGIQFSYPQLFKNPITHEAEKVIAGETFPNTALFQNLQRWLRQHSQPTPFIVSGKKTNVPIRLGKKCFAWINQHPQLLEKGIKVDAKV